MSVQTQIVVPAFQDLGIVASGETPATAELNDALALLNQIVDAWSNERLTSYSIVHGTFSLSAATATYTMGSGATFNTASTPRKIIGALAFSGNFQKGMGIVSMSELRLRQQNGKGITAALPSLLAHDNTLANITVEVWPTPDVSGSLKLDYLLVLSAFASLAAAVSLPPGFELIYRYYLAIGLAPQYGKEVGPTLAANAKNAKQGLVDLNAQILGDIPAAPVSEAA